MDKAQEQLDSARLKEIWELHNFELMELTIEDEINFGTKELRATKNRGEELKALAIAKDKADTTAAEEAAIAAFKELMAAKTRDITAPTQKYRG